LSLTAGDVILGVGGTFTEPVTTSAVLGSRGDAGGVSDVVPQEVTGSDPSADG